MSSSADSPLGLPQHLREVLLVLEPEPRRHVHDAVVGPAELVDRQPLVGRHVRHVLRQHRHDDDPLVQHVVELDVGPQRQRRGELRRVREHRGARHPGDVARVELGRRTPAAAPPRRPGAR